MVDVLPHALLLPAAKIVIDRLPRWQIMWQQPPCGACPQKVEDGVDQFARRRLSRPPAGSRIRDQRRDQLPLRVGHISIVAPPRWRLPLRHRASARVVGPTPYESHQHRLGNPSQTRSEISDDVLVEALTSTKVVLIADEANLSSHSAQSAFV